LIIAGIGFTVMTDVALGPGHPSIVTLAVITTVATLLPVLVSIIAGTKELLPFVGDTPPTVVAAVFHEYVTPETPDERSIGNVVSPEQMV
jgi:hypothetical protein